MELLNVFKKRISSFRSEVKNQALIEKELYFISTPTNVVVLHEGLRTPVARNLGRNTQIHEGGETMS